MASLTEGIRAPGVDLHLLCLRLLVRRGITAAVGDTGSEIKLSD